MARAPVMAAGGIVVRAGARPLVAIVQRSKDSCWVLPKGKLKPGEKAAAAARREAIEETGHDVAVHDFLGALTYDKGRRSKVVTFWRMEAVGDAGKLMPDIKAVCWLPLKVAIARLDDPLEQVFLRHVGRRVIAQSRAQPADESRDTTARPAPLPTPQMAAPQVTVSNAPATRPALWQRAWQLLMRAASLVLRGSPN